MTNIRPPQQGHGCASGCVGSGLARLLGRTLGQVQELMRGLDRFGAIGAREQAVVADAVEALGQEVDEKAADELVDSQGGCFECSQ
jgi:hypothetical protein